MHCHITHNRCYATFIMEFSTSMLTLLRDHVPNRRDYCDEVTDNFRIIIPTDFRITA
jgi:hypothetical protein